MDSAKLAEVIGVSDAQLRFVSNSPSGTGLLKCGSVVIPFDNQISKDSELYKLYNTNIHEKIAMGITGENTKTQSVEPEPYVSDTEQMSMETENRTMPVMSWEQPEKEYVQEPQDFRMSVKEAQDVGMPVKEEPEDGQDDGSWMIYG